MSRKNGTGGLVAKSEMTFDLIKFRAYMSAVTGTRAEVDDLTKWLQWLVGYAIAQADAGDKQARTILRDIAMDLEPCKADACTAKVERDDMPRKRLPMAFDVIKDGAWKDQPAFIIGGGSSLRGWGGVPLPKHKHRTWNWSQLYGLNTIGVNMSYLCDPTIVYFSDAALLRMLESDPTCGWKQCVSIKLINRGMEPYYHMHGERRVRLDGCYWVECTKRKRTDWGDSIRSLCSGTNAGMVAINIADVLGANPIYLLGFDMYGKGGMAKHWHDYYVGTDRLTDSKAYTVMLQDFATRVPDHVIEKTYNASEQSRLEMFPKISLDKLTAAVDAAQEAMQ